MTVRRVRLEAPTSAGSPSDEESWIAVRVEPAGEMQVIVDAIFSLGALGVQEDDGAIVTHFPPGTVVERVCAAIIAVDQNAHVRIGRAPRTDWSQWRASVGANQVGCLSIVPPWLASGRDSATTVIIDPAMAFGTGEHATTRGVARLMQRLPAMPATVADLGAGSAVLSICAARLGAKRVFAIEVDPDAMGNAESNVLANDVGEAIHLLQGDAAVLLPLLAPVELVLANIMSSVLCALLPTIHHSMAPAGHAILSGVPVEERAVMIDAISAAQWTVVEEDREDGWWSVLLAHRP